MKDTLYLRFLFGIYTRYKYLMTKQPEKGQTLCIWIPMLQIRLEILRNPNLQNTPVVLLNPKKINRRTVWQCSKEALEMGIYLNQPVSQAFSFCQNLTALEPDLDYYNSMERNISGTLSRLSPEIESAGDGRFFVNVDGLQHLHKFGSDRIRENVHRQFDQFPDSLVSYIRIGWAKGKFASWIAATTAKPNKPVIVEDQKLISFLKRSPISLLPTDKDIIRRLQQFGIRTLGELTLLPTPTLVRQFGEKGEIARTWATGEKIDLVQPNQSLKSIRHSMDFHTPIGNVEIVCKSLKKLLETALADLKHQNQSVQGIRIKGLWTKGSWSLNHILRNPSISHEDIYRTLRTNILISPPTSPIEKLTLEFFQFYTFELQEDFFNHEKSRWEVPNNKKIAKGTIPSSLREAITEMKLRMGFSPLYRIVEIDPLSRIPERRHALLNIEI